MTTDEIEIHRTGEWSGLYRNGVLQVHGDHYRADEWLYRHFGVKVVHDSPWLLDGSVPLHTLAEVGRAAEDERNRLAESARLREQAAELLAEADRLDPHAKVNR